MGCGKSTASRLFAEQGFSLIDCDAIVRDEVLVDPSIVAQLSERFGRQIAPHGVIDRQALASIVFKEAEQLRWLESVVHPEVSRRWRSRTAANPSTFWIVEVPLLFEKELHKLFDFVVCVACCEPQQLVRLEKRGVSRELAKQRIAQQLPLSRKVERSDFVLSNDGSLEFLESQVCHLSKRLKASTLSKA